MINIIDFNITNNNFNNKIFIHFKYFIDYLNLVNITNL